jgi:hypothetical protein
VTRQEFQIDEARAGLPLGLQAAAEVTQVIVGAFLLCAGLEVEADRRDFQERSEAVLHGGAQALKRLILTHFPLQDRHIMTVIKHERSSLWQASDNLPPWPAAYMLVASYDSILSGINVVEFFINQKSMSKNARCADRLPPPTGKTERPRIPLEYVLA